VGVVLNHIKTSACPVCQCGVVISEDVEVHNGVVRRHVNGQQWESRDFLCGYGVQWVPNYSREEVYKRCRSDKEISARRAAFLELCDAMDKAVDRFENKDLRNSDRKEAKEKVDSLRWSAEYRTFYANERE
jgi:hypothetical protein